MEKDEKGLAAEYAEAGIELPPEPVITPESTPEEATPEEKEPVIPEGKLEESPEDSKETEKTSNSDDTLDKPVKRSIYKDLKDTRKEMKTERELRLQAEAERDELKQKLEAVNTAATPSERKEAVSDLEAFAKEIDADPATLARMREVFLKDLNVPQVDPEALQRFMDWEKNNREAIDTQSFEAEFRTALPSIKSMFPDATQEEIDVIKTKINEIAHTEQYHDKEIDYIVFKNQTSLKELVSPKKRGLESKGRTDATAPEFTFNPNADLSKMSDKELAQWEAEYAKLTKPTELSTDAEGKRIFI